MHQTQVDPQNFADVICTWPLCLLDKKLPICFKRLDPDPYNRQASLARLGLQSFTARYTYYILLFRFLSLMRFYFAEDTTTVLASEFREPHLTIIAAFYLNFCPEIH